MLGIRLSREAEERLERHARATGRAKSTLAREWILDRLQRESVDGDMRRAAELLAKTLSGEELRDAEAATAEWLRLLDEEDGGYDWGPEGPPL